MNITNASTSIMPVEYRVFLTSRQSMLVSAGEYAQLVNKQMIEQKADKIVKSPGKRNIVKRLITGQLLKAYINRCKVDFRAFSDDTGKIIIYKLAVYVMDYLENYVSAYVARALASFLGKMIKHRALYAS